MTRLIDADALKEDFSKWFGADDIPSMVVEDIIDNAPTITINTNDEDGKKIARPQGEWIKNAEEWQRIDPPYFCSECGHANLRKTPFCEMCGADMREEADNETN